MLDPTHNDILVKYDSTEDLDFDADELAFICGVLNLDITTFDEARLPEYRRMISQAMHEQSKVMTEIGGEYLRRVYADLELAAFHYVVRNIARIKSPYMLNILVGLLAHKSE